MALTIGDNFKYQANKPNFERDSFATLEAMKAYPETSIDDGHLSYCAETNKHYKFLSSNTVDETTGKWREFETTTGNNIVYINSDEFDSSPISQDIYDKLVNAITNNKLIGLYINHNTTFTRVYCICGMYYADTGDITLEMDFNLNEHSTITVHSDLSTEVNTVRPFDKVVHKESLNLFSFDISENTVTYSPDTVGTLSANNYLSIFKNNGIIIFKVLTTGDSTILYPYISVNDSTDVPGGSISFIGTLKYNDIFYDITVSIVGIYGDAHDKQLVIEASPHAQIESIPVATTETNGLMSAEDKAKLDGVSNNANNYTHPAGSAASKSLGLYKISTDSASHVESVSPVTKSDITSLGIPAQDTTYNNATQSTAGLMSAADKKKLDNLDTSGTVSDERALKGATMRFNGFVNGVTVTQTGVNEWNGIVYDTSINKFLAKKGTLTPTYHNIWSGMDAYMSDELGTSILKDKLYIYGENVYKWSDSEGTLVKITSEGSSTTPDIPLATQNTDGLMSSEDKTKLDNIDVDSVTKVINDKRALNGATMRFSSFVNGVTVEQVGTVEFDSIVFDTAISKFLAKKNGTLSPTYYNVWQGMDAYMSDESGTSILKDKLYICDDIVYSWSDTGNTLVKVDKEISNATQSKAGLMSAEDKTKLDNVISRVVLSEFSERKFFGEFSKVTGASAIGWAGALFIDDFSSSEYRDFYCCMTYGQGIVIRHTYKTGTYEYLNSFMVDSSTTSSTYNITNKMNSGGWGKYYNNSELPLAYISRCSPNASYIHTYYAYKINRSVTPFAFERVLTIKYGGSKLAAITSDITIDAEKKYLYVHGYKSGSADAITGTSIVMVFNLPEPGSSDTITLNDSDILWEFEFFVNEAAQDLCVSGGKLYYPYGSGALHGLAVIDTKTGKIIQNLDLSTLSTNFINNPEPEGVALSNGNVYLNYHHAGTNSNEVCLVEFPLQEVKEAVKVPTKVSQLENDAEYITAKGDLLERLYMYGIEFDTTVADPECTRIGNPELHRTLPIHSQMRGCLLDDYGKVIRYLNPDTWLDETLDGSNGQVMVEIPEFYVKFEEDGTKRRVKMSPVLIPGYIKVSKAYISAYEATVQRSTSKLSSVCNEDADYRGGNNDSSRDGTYRTQLGMPATQMLVDNLRGYARKRGTGWHCYSYHLHKILWWLFAVEYANFDSQGPFNSALDENGYHQGGLGKGVTTIDGSAWSAFNGYFPLVPCGVTNSLGNHTGTVDYSLIGSDDLVITTFAVPRYRGIENPFGHLWKSLDGCKSVIQSDTAGGSSRFYVCNNPLNFVSDISENYSSLGDLPRKSGSISSIAFGENGEIIPSEVGGGSITYFCDYFYTGIPSSGKEDRYISVGGGADNLAFAGFLFMYTNVGGENGTNICTRLCCTPNYN